MVKGKVSIIIVNLNRKKDIKECLVSVMEQDYSNKEVIVIDNNSNDGSIEMIEKEFPKVMLIKNKKNLGACIARNIGIKKAGGDFIWFLDNDSLIFKKNTLTSMMELIENEKIGAVGGESWVENGVEKGLKKRILLKNGETVWVDIKIDDKIIKSDYFSTSNFLVKKEILYDLGGFNPIYFYLFEDVDISYKIRKKGLDLISNENTIVYHKQSQDQRRTKIQSFSSFFLNNKRRITFIVLNFNIFYLAILPFLDIYYLFNPLKIGMLRNKVKRESKEPSKKQNKIHAYLGILKMFFSYFGGLFSAYVWILFNLLKIIRTKNKKFILENNI